VVGVSDATIVGESREDLAWNATIETDERNETLAQQAAEHVAIEIDHADEALTIAPRTDAGARVTIRLALRVPRDLTVHVEGARRTEVRGVAGVELARAVDAVTLRDITGTVTGRHSNGELSMTNVGGVVLTLFESDLRLSGIRGATRIAARRGASHIEGAAGPIDVEIEDHRSTILSPSEAVQLSGAGGEVRIERPRARVSVDVRRSAVSVALDVAVPVTVFTTDRPMDLSLDPRLPLGLDARASGGAVTVPDGAEWAADADRSSMRRERPDDVARVVLRNQRADIVINQIK
jgi:hypothetical protein